MKIFPGGLVVLGCLVWGGPVFAFRGPILNLRELCSYAEVIVVAEVREVEKVDEKRFGNSVARLKVKQWIKGKEAETPIRVLFHDYGSDPPSAEYPEGATVLAFLNYNEEGNIYFTCGGHEGTKITRKVVDAYLLRIEELKKILPLRVSQSVMKNYSAWLMKCVADECTRSEGLGDLLNFSLPKPNENAYVEVEGWRYLTDELKQQLATVISGTSMGELGDYYPYYDTLKMMLILARTENENEELMEIRARYKELDYPWVHPETAQKHKQLCKEFVDRYRALSEVSGKAASRLLTRLQTGESQVVVAYGTSLTAAGAWVGQVEKVFEAKFPGQVTMVNSGGSGMNSDWGVEHLEPRVLKKHPDTVFLEFAINDSVARFDLSVEKAKSNLEKMIDYILKENPNCEIILMTMTPGNKYPEGHRSHRKNIEAYYGMYRAVAKERGLMLIDHSPHWIKLQKEDAEHFNVLVPDTIHPTAAGNAEVVTPVVLKALGLDAYEK